MYTDTFQQGPLAQVWMAANYEKRLTKQQFLNTNLIKSSEILNQPLNNHITLRLSGQLLLGIVKIYSRKTKYLLDDVNDILFKLKNAFKLASGGVLLGSENHRTKVSEKNNIVDINHLMLNDQITAHDLLYQEEFILDDELSSVPFSILRSQSPEADDRNLSDMSIEYGRMVQDDDNDNLDFDLNLNDDSIEIGRDISLPPQEQSLMDIGGKEIDINLGPIVEETFLEHESPSINEPVTPEPLPVRKIVGITENGLIKTTKRKLQIDEVSQITTTVEELIHLRELQLLGDWRNDAVNFKLSDKEKLELIQELSVPAGFKRRKFWNLNQELANICNDISEREQHDLDNELPTFEEPAFDSFDDDQQPDLNFDISIPEFDNQDIDSEPEFEIQSTIADATKRIAKIIENGAHDFNDVVNQDIKHPSPLGLVQKPNGNVINMKKEASRCFFELLVLASRDCIKLQQQSGDAETDIGGAIDLTVTDKLNFFV